MQRVCEVEPGLIGVESPRHAGRLIGSQARQAEQGAEKALDVAGRKAVGRAQGPFRLKQYGRPDEDGRNERDEAEAAALLYQL